MTVLKRSLSRKQQEVYGEKSVEFSLLSIGGLILAQVTEGGLTLRLGVVGIGLAALGIIASHFFLRNLKD